MEISSHAAKVRFSEVNRTLVSLNFIVFLIYKEKNVQVAETNVTFIELLARKIISWVTPIALLKICPFLMIFVKNDIKKKYLFM